MTWTGVNPNPLSTQGNLPADPTEKEISYH